MSTYLMHRRVLFGLLFFIICGVNFVNAIKCGDNKSALNIAVIGAGASGLSSAKHSIAQGHKVTVFEQGEEIGGVWVFTNQTGKDKYGNNIHSAMYQGLRANGPYQELEFPNHHFPNGTVSFPSHSEILKYLQSYSDRFDLNKHIKLNHLVVRVLPIENGKWEVTVKDLPNNRFVIQIFDAIFVCNGHYFAPNIPKIEGANEFSGKVIHSHDFRSAQAFRGERVLVIGASASGLDLVLHLSKVAESVTLSQNKSPNQTKREKRQSSLPQKTSLKDNVKRFVGDEAEFIDGTKEKFTAIIYATGYKYSFPFLSVDTGIHVDDNFVQPLYKQIFNIEHPTMAFIGIPMSAINFYLFDLQVRFALKFISGEKELPTKQEMLMDQRIQTEKIWSKGFPKHRTHLLVPIQRDYFNQLSELADIENIPVVLDALAIDGFQHLLEQPTEYRKYKYTVIDDKTYTKERYED